MLCVFRVISKSLGWKCWFPKIISSSRWLYSVCMLVFEGVNRLINAKMASYQKIKQSFPQVHFSLKPSPSIYQHIYIYLLICFPLHLNKNRSMPSKMRGIGMQCFVEPWTAPKSQIFKLTERLLRNSEIEVYFYTTGSLIELKWLHTCWMLRNWVYADSNARGNHAVSI